MAKTHHPRRGSLQYWPRKRARKIRPRINSWKAVEEVKLLGFLGYKAGMSHVIVKEKRGRKEEEIFYPVTILECPPLKPLAIRFYKKTENGLMVIKDVYAEKFDKELSRKFKPPKKKVEIPKMEEFDDLRLIVYTRPKNTSIGKKKPDIIELGIGGKSKEEKLEFAKNLLGKEEIKVSEIFKQGQFVDVHGVTKGKGFQGTVKRYGVAVKQHKSEKTKRGIGTLGPWTPKRVLYSVPQPGKMGFHLRTEFNKFIIKIGDKVEEINPKGGLVNYGFIKNEYVIIKGSIPGSKKRPVVLTEAQRPPKKIPQITEIIHISQKSQQ